MRGRKPKPTQLRIIEGNLGKRAINHDEPEIEGVLGEAPAHLPARHQYYWRQVLAATPPGMITPTDAGTLTVYVTAMADVEFATAKIDEAGLVIRMPNGPPGSFMQNPYVSIRRAAMQIVLKAGAELGLTPSSRSRVKVQRQKKPSSVLGKLRSFQVD